MQTKIVISTLAALAFAASIYMIASSGETLEGNSETIPTTVNVVDED